MKSRTFITGISDFHVFTTSIMKLTYTKGNPKNCNKMMLSENDQIISDETTIADTMNKYFVNITKK